MSAPGLLSPKLRRRILLGCLLGAALYVAIALWADLGAMRAAARPFPWGALAAACGLSLGNYLVRFLRWQRYCALLGVRVGRADSLWIHLSGLALTVTPGKLGEAFKSVLLRQVDGTPIHRSAPIVVAERFTDLVGFLVLVAVGGLATAPELAWGFWATLAGCAALLALAGSPRVARAVTRGVARLPLVARLAPRVEGAFESTRALLRLRELPRAVALATVGWALECVGCWLVVDALAPGAAPLLFATFAYAVSAVVGAVLLVFPGGLGVTEASLGGLLARRLEAAGMARDLAHAKAAAATILIRLCTLWFAVAVGLLALAVFSRRQRRAAGAVSARPR